jgi:hypothetical protein
MRLSLPISILLFGSLQRDLARPLHEHLHHLFSSRKIWEGGSEVHKAKRFRTYVAFNRLDCVSMTTTHFEPMYLFLIFIKTAPHIFLVKRRIQLLIFHFRYSSGLMIIKHPLQ